MFGYDKISYDTIADIIAEMIRDGSVEEFHTVLQGLGGLAPKQIVDVLAEKIRGGDEVITPAFILCHYIESGNEYARDVVEGLIENLGSEQFFLFVVTMFAFYVLSPNREFERIMEVAMRVASDSHRTKEIVSAIMFGATALREIFSDILVRAYNESPLCA